MGRDLRPVRVILAERVAAAAEALAHHEVRGLERAACVAELAAARRLLLVQTYHLPAHRRGATADLVGADGRPTHREPAAIRPLTWHLPRDPEAAALELDRGALGETIRSLTVAMAWAAWVGGADLADYPRAGGWYAPADCSAVLELGQWLLNDGPTWARGVAYARALCRAWRASTRALNAAREERGAKPLPLAHGCESQIAWCVQHQPAGNVVSAVAK